MNAKIHPQFIALLTASMFAASGSANAQDSCLQRRVGKPPAPSVAHWIVTNVCGYTVKFKAYMTNGQVTFNVYTTELGKLVDPNPGFPITVTIKPGMEQNFYFSSTFGSYTFVTENVVMIP